MFYKFNISNIFYKFNVSNVFYKLQEVLK